MTQFTDTHWVAVRCCCQPKKVLGFLQVSDEVYRQGRFHSAYLDGPVTLRRMAHVKRGPDMELSVSGELAIYSEDRPIEQWRRVPGFLEVL